VKYYHSDNCHVSDKGVEQLRRTPQLTELRLGSSAEEADGDINTFTINGLTAVLCTLKTTPKLRVLEMQLPHVKEFNISGRGTYFLLNVGIGDKET
jgi:hypothetical protein